ncbi:MAG TPA: PP2C family protein-serine/threonine phosphatase [Planctomycetaceae bacterium]|nr:PP2C family protein-serine/threonine phosphatase [Planctomycetaceae bacterium]
MTSNVSSSAVNDWQQRLTLIVETMRDMSRHTDPQEMVRAYGERIQQLGPFGRRLSLSRRGLSRPQYRITRSTTWKEVVNPWKEKERLPLLTGGLLAELIYADEPRVFDELEIASDDPAAEYLAGQRSLLAIPMFDRGEALNMVVLMRETPGGFPSEDVPDLVWRTNLFGRATANLVLTDELQQAYRALDREFQIVGDIQRALLPAELPQIPTLDIAVHYQPAQRAGGDYYDFFPLPGGQWGIFIGDVSGHGTPAAVLMAVTHCIAHSHPGPAAPPGRVLGYLNHHLATRYASLSETFVTAFYAIYDPATRRLTYASAGHNPPRVQSCENGTLLSLDGAHGLPLGIRPEERYPETIQQLHPGDQIIFYTDGITEARNPGGELYGTERLDRDLANCAFQARGLLDSVLASVEAFADGQPADDDRTLIVARVT